MIWVSQSSGELLSNHLVGEADPLRWFVISTCDGELTQGGVAWDLRRATNCVIVSPSICNSLEKVILCSSLWVAFTVTALMCSRRLSSLLMSRVVTPTNSNRNLLTSLKQAALSSMRLSSVIVMLVIVLYRRHESLKSSHSRSSMF